MNPQTPGFFKPKEPLTVYILGPMRNKPKYNFPAFDAAAEKAWNAGHGVINPAQLDRESGFDVDSLPADHDWSRIDNLGENHKMTLDSIVNRDLDALKKCNAYIALPGWEKSKGATAEKAVLDWKCAKRLDPETLEPISPNIELGPTGPVGGPGAVGVVGTNPKDLCGMKKPPMTLIPTSSLFYLSRVMELGAKKYTPFNWRNPKTPVKLTVYLAAAWRHLLQILDGENNDPESNNPHAAHAMACFAIILDAQACGTLVDDRPLPGAASKVIAELTTK